MGVPMLVINGCRVLLVATRITPASYTCRLTEGWMSMNNTNNLTTKQAIEIFGKPDVQTIAEDKIREFKKPGHPRFTQAQRDYLAYRMGTDRAHWAIEFSEAKKRAIRKAELVYWCKLFLRVTDTPRTSGFTDEQMRRAREYPTHELYEGRLIRSGQNFKCKCPFHDDRTPSFFFYADGSYHCFGCQAHGNNALDYVMQLEKLSFKDAVRRLL